MKAKLYLVMNSSRLLNGFLFVSFDSFDSFAAYLHKYMYRYALMEFQPKRLLLNTMAHRFIRTDRAQLANNFVRFGVAVVAAVFHIGYIQGKTISRLFCRIVLFFI